MTPTLMKLASYLYSVLLGWNLVSVQFTNAATLVSNLDEPLGTTFASYIDRYLATPFTVGSAPASIDRIDLPMHYSGNGGSHFVELWADDANLPGAPIMRLAGESHPTSNGVFAYTPTTELTLNGDTRYWLVVFSAFVGSATEQFHTTLSSSETGCGQIFSPTLTAFEPPTWRTLTWLFEGAHTPVTLQFAVIGQQVPEPSASIFGLFSLAGIAIMRRRRMCIPAK